MQFENHYYYTPPELSETKEDCWAALSAYLEKHATNRLVVFRDVPQVLSEKDFAKSKVVHKGFVRFSASPEKLEDITYKIPSIGEA